MTPPDPTPRFRFGTDASDGPERRFNLGHNPSYFVDVTLYYPRPWWARVLSRLLPVAWLWNRVGLPRTVGTTFEVPNA